MVFYCDNHDRYFKSYEAFLKHGGCHIPPNKLSGGRTAYGFNK